MSKQLAFQVSLKIVQSPNKVFEALSQTREVRRTRHWLSEQTSCEDVVLTFRHLKRIGGNVYSKREIGERHGPTTFGERGRRIVEGITIGGGQSA